LSPTPKQTEDQFRLLVEGVTDYAIFMLDSEGRVATWNAGAERINGYTAGEILGQHFSVLYTDAAREAGHPQHELEVAAQEGRYEEEGWRVRKDGTHFWSSVIITALFDRSGEVIGFGKVTRDITERKRAEEELRASAATIQALNRDLERRVESRTAELREAIDDLEGFTYSVSHDLRGPLRGIDGFSKILLDEHAGQLDAEGRRLLDVIRSNTRNMAQLIEDLLSFSLVGRRELDVTSIDMTSLARAVVAQLAPAPAGTRVEVTVDRLPRAVGDRTLIRQVLDNLVSNALKFSASQPVPRIEIGASDDRTDDSVFWVKDNGVGFDMQYHQKMFEVFQRLRPTEFEGTGVGLAIVERILRRHGGRVWAIGEPGAGATFYFSLPAPASD
jgi:PAS domain S-box-containing protein